MPYTHAPGLTGVADPAAPPAAASAPPRVPVERRVAPVPLASFARTLWRVARARTSAGNAVALLRDGPATYDAMRALVAGARETVDLESYILRDDEVGEEIATVLREAVGRGVRVRLLTDWIGARGISRRWVDGLRRDGIQVAMFNPPAFRSRWFGLLPRDHRKLLVVDGAAGVIGGVGIGREWKPGPGATAGTQWRDTAVRISGPAGDDMGRAFEAMWQRAHRRRWRRPPRVQQPAPEHVEPPAPAARVAIVEGDPLRFRVARAFQLHALTARRSIWIADAYFMPNFGELETLVGAARDGVDVRVLVPSIQWWSEMLGITRRYYHRLLAAGVRVFEWSGAMMHAKTTVIDGHLMRVGSTDFNPLGMGINFELDAVIEDAALGAEAEAMFVADIEQSQEITSVPGWIRRRE